VAATIVFSGDDGQLDVTESYAELAGMLQGGSMFFEVHPSGGSGEAFLVSIARVLYVRNAGSGPFGA
jgi:hypothetical protein